MLDFKKSDELSARASTLNADAVDAFAAAMENQADAIQNNKDNQGKSGNHDEYWNLQNYLQ